MIRISTDAPLISDFIPGRGPLGGIYSGLRATRTEFNMFLACDLPFVSARLLRFVIERAVVGEADVTVPESRDGEYQPLCAVYRKRALPAIRASLARGQNKVMRFFRYIQCCVISWAELAGEGFPAWVFDNMNTPEEYQAVKRTIGGM